jgi:hypothetical protein
MAEMNAMLPALFDFILSSVQTDHASCLSRTISLLNEKLNFKYALLLPIGLSDAQKHEKKLQFVHDIREGLENIFVCTTHEKEERKSPEQAEAKLLAVLENLKHFKDYKHVKDMKSKLQRDATKTSFGQGFDSSFRRPYAF